jgi:prolipoprotein diacylglyceryl transferase
MTAAIPSPSSNVVHLGPLTVHVYGLMYVVGITAAVVLGRRRWAARGGDPDVIYDIALWAVPAGILGGRLYFDLTTPKYIPSHWWGPIAVWDGGLGIWGGIALGALVGVWRARRKGLALGPLMDAAAPCLLVAQAIGRVGNYFNQELFGGPSSLPWAIEISPAHRPAGYERYATFHPTFLYELIFDLLFAAFLAWLGSHRRIRPPGLFALYVAGYSTFRLFEESLRVDPSEHLLGLRLNFYVAGILAAAGLLWFVRIQFPQRVTRRRATTLLATGGLALAAGGCGHASSGTAAVAHARPGAVQTVSGMQLVAGTRPERSSSSAGSDRPCCLRGLRPGALRGVL